MKISELENFEKFKNVAKSEEKVAIMQKILAPKSLDELGKILKIDKKKVDKEVKELVGYGLVMPVDKETYQLSRIGIVFMCVLKGRPDLAEKFIMHSLDAHAVRDALAS